MHIIQISSGVKKIIPHLFVSTVAILSLPSRAFADDPTPTPLIDDKGDIITIAENIAQWIYRLFFVVAVLYILLAAYQYLTARDDAATVKKAQASLKNAVIAIIVALVSTGLSLLVKSFL